MNDGRILQRKAGCVTLVVACVFNGAWVRSYSCHDFVQISFRGTLYLISVHGELESIRMTTLLPVSSYYEKLVNAPVESAWPDVTFGFATGDDFWT